MVSYHFVSQKEGQTSVSVKPEVNMTKDSKISIKYNDNIVYWKNINAPSYIFVDSTPSPVHANRSKRRKR